MNYSGSYSNNDGIASATGSNPLTMGDYLYDPYLSVPQSTYPGPVSVPGYPSAAGSYVPDFNAADNAAFSIAPTTEMGAFALPIQADPTNQNILDPWSMPGPSTYNMNFAVSQPQLVGDPYQTGVDPLASYLAATTPDMSAPDSGVSSTPTTPTSPETWAWLSDFFLSPSTTPASSPEVGLVVPEHGTNASEVTTSPTGGDACGFPWPIPAAPGDVTSNVTTTFDPAGALGKRRHEAEGDGGPAGIHTHEMPPPKRARGSETNKGIPKAARSTARTRRKPVARIPRSKTSEKPKEAGRGAERLATPSSQGVYHQSLPGPSFQQGWSVDAVNGTPIWVEGSVEEEVVHHIDSTVQQEAGLFVIPRRLDPDHRLFLQISEADVARNAVQKIECRLCPGTSLKDFEEFKRHCDTSENHPLHISPCNNCGIHFARSDSLKRHINKKSGCDGVTPAKVNEMCRVIKEMHVVFRDRMMQSLRVGGGISRGFSQIVKERYPECCKKSKGVTKKSKGVNKKRKGGNK